MTLDATGMSVRRQAEWVTWLRDKLRQNLNFQPEFDEDDELTHLTNVIATMVALQDEDKLAVYQSLDIDQAEGVSLDREMRKLRSTRNVATKTSGDVRFYGDNGSGIPKDTRLQNPYTEQEFVVKNTRTLDQSSCDAVTYLPSAVVDGKVYSFDLNGITYSYTASSGDTLNTVITSLANSVTNASLDGITAGISTPDNTIRIYTTTDEATLVLTNNTELTIEQVELDVPVEAVDEGPVNGQQYAVNTLVTPLGGIDQVQNLNTLGLGSTRETDVEFRTRSLSTLEQSGGGTTPSIIAEVLDVEEVSSVTVLENTTNTVDANGVPAQSIRVIVVAPDTSEINTAIATAIASKRPAGRRTDGTTVVSVSVGGEEVDIRFSRPTEVPIAVRVTATRDTEHSLPTDATSLIKGAIVARGGSFGTGNDVKSARLVSATSDIVPDALDEIVVEMQTLAISGDVPVLEDWSETKISISDSQSSVFNVQDVYVTIT